MKPTILLLTCVLHLNAETGAGKANFPKAGADQASPSRSQYFSWINNTNEGTTEAQTLANLAFFQWLHDEFGMTLDIYAFDAGFVDGKLFSAILNESPRFKRQFPQGLDRVFRTAAGMGTRLGHWGGPDGFGDTPGQEQARIDMMAGLCRDYDWALYKFDAVCGQLRPEKEPSFIRMMKASRVHSPDLIALNHRLPLGEEGLSLMTTSLWDGEETYVDVHVGNRMTAPHHRAGAMARGNTPALDRRFEDHGVCKQVSQITEGGALSVTFDGTPPAGPWHRKLSLLEPTRLPADAAALYEATCFAADNNALESRALARSGDTAIPAVKAARDAFFQQRVFVGRGLWDRYLFDGDPATCFHVTSRRRVASQTGQDPPVRIDFGGIITPEMIGKDLDVVIVGGAEAVDTLRAEVWQTAHTAPFSEKWLILE